MTKFEQHKLTWGHCQNCSLCERRSKVVFLRGSIPADVLLVGEAPGPSEDVIGKPFVGPAGKLLDNIIYEGIGPEVRYALTNLVACIPYDVDGIKAGEPEKESILACAPRLAEIVKIVRPRLIVRVGALSKKWITGSPGAAGYELVFANAVKLAVDWTPTIKFADIVHPAAIIRQNVAMQGLSIQKAAVTLSNAIDEL